MKDSGVKNESESDNDQSSEKVGEVVSIKRRSGKWHVNYQHGGKQVRRSLKTSSKKNARPRALAIERDLLTGNIKSDKRPPLIAEVADDFRAAKVGEGLARRTLKKYDHGIKLMKELAEELELTRISQITPSFMDKFRAKRVAALSKTPGRDGQNTAVKDIVLIREIVNYALNRKLLRDDPLEGYKIKKAARKPQPCWNQDEFDAIIAAAGRQPHKDVYHLLGLTGMRIGEVEHLTWGDLDFENKVIKIQAKPDWKPKTGDARSVPMMAGVKEILERQLRRCEWVFSFPADGRGSARQVRQRRLLDYLKRLLKTLGLRGHLHTFRHTFVSMAATRGIEQATIRAWVGHIDRETLEYYMHIASRDSQSAMQRLEASIQERRSSS
jgi:integrase